MASEKVKSPGSSGVEEGLDKVKRIFYNKFERIK
jgi:hypothetical protein